MLKNINRRILLIAVVLGLAASYLVYSHLSRVEETYLVPVEQKPVVVAATTIPPQVRISREMVRVEEMPVKYILSSSLAGLDDVVGSISKVEIVKGEQVAASRIFRGEKDDAFAYLVPDNMRAAAIPVNEVIAVGNLIQPGDRVDVLLVHTLEEGGSAVLETTHLLQDVELLAVGQLTDPQRASSSAEGFKTVTLALKPEEAQILTLAEQVGSFKLALRSPLDRRVLTIKPQRERDIGGSE